MITKKVQVFGVASRKIDLTGPQGNAFYLLSLASRWMKQINPERVDDVLNQMKSTTYPKLVAYFEIHFGSICELELEMEEGLAHEVQEEVEKIRDTKDVIWDLKTLGFDDLEN